MFQAVFYVDIVGSQISHFQKEEIFKVGSVFNLIDISSGSAHHGQCYRVNQGGSDGSVRQSCKCNYVDITKMPGPHADTARVMPGAHAHIAHTVCVKPGSHADTVCVKPGPHADINLKSKQSKIYNIFFSIKTITMRNEPRQPTFPTQGGEGLLAFGHHIKMLDVGPV